MNPARITDIRDRLRENGGVTLTGPDGKALFLVLNSNIGVEEHGILIAYQGQGATFFNLDRPLNQFRLAQEGFTLSLARRLADLVNAILDPNHVEPETHVALLSHIKD